MNSLKEERYRRRYTAAATTRLFDSFDCGRSLPDRDARSSVRRLSPPRTACSERDHVLRLNAAKRHSTGIYPTGREAGGRQWSPKPSEHATGWRPCLLTIRFLSSEQDRDHRGGYSITSISRSGEVSHDQPGARVPPQECIVVSRRTGGFG